MKYYNFIIGMVVGGIISALGGWDIHLSVLITFILLDYLTGLVVALVFKKSPKTKTGGLKSTVGYIGICKKLMMILMVAVAVKLDLLLEIHLIRNGTIIAFIINELLSLIENAGLMGLQIPSIITKSIDMLRAKEDEL